MTRNTLPPRTTMLLGLSFVLVLSAVLLIAVPPLGVALLAWGIWEGVTHRRRLEAAHQAALAEHKRIHGW